jgi:hypothetical protein
VDECFPTRDEARAAARRAIERQIKPVASLPAN